MNTRAYAFTSSIIFFLVALMHLLRLIQQWNVIINGWYVPAWVSIVSLLVAGFLSLQGFRLFRQGGWFSWLSIGVMPFSMDLERSLPLSGMPSRSIYPQPAIFCFLQLSS